MGVVWLAREYASGRVVAMKLLRHPSDRSAYDRFLVELRALAGVDHPGVVRVFASDFLRPDPFFTMEYVQGGSLAGLMVLRGPLPAVEAARIIASAAKGVHAAHEAGVIHRDLKPSNILLTEDGIPKVSDFGLAKRTEHEDGLTTASGPVGTPGYMAPEQASRHFGSPGERADVYGLGATLYHLVTGQPPFTGSNADVVNQVLTTPPVRPRAIIPEIPAGLEAVILKCLEKVPAHRYQTAADLANDLERFLAGQKTEAPELTPLRRMWQSVRPRLVPIALLTLLVAIVFALGAAVWPGPKPIDSVAEARKELAAGLPVTLIGEKGLPAYSRNVLAPDTFGEDPVTKTCTLNMFGHAVVELFPAPGISHYRIDLELRHLASQAAAAAGDKVETDFMGMYFGYSSAPAADNSAIHAMFAVTFRDSDHDAFMNGVKPRPQPVLLNHYGFHQRGDTLPRPWSNMVEALQFTPPRFRPGPWRPVSIECAPDKLLVQWKDDAGKMVSLADWPKEKLIAHYDSLRAEIDRELAPGAEKNLPHWNPDAPFGLVGFKASLAVRNVVVTPLP
jgi:serine/threonine-protein kinase